MSFNSHQNIIKNINNLDKTILKFFRTVLSIQYSKKITEYYKCIYLYNIVNVCIIIEYKLQINLNKKKTNSF